MSSCIKTIPILIKWFVFFRIILHSSNAIDNQRTEESSPDFIIVGGGLSGCVVAGRLSEKYSVLLLEAGGDPGDELDVPALSLSQLGKIPGISKIYSSVPQRNAALISPSNGKVSFVIGTTLGGGSSVNTLIHNRGSPYDYDNWANVTNDHSWNYENLLKYFKRMEDYEGGFPSEENHGKNGPLPISTSKYAPGLQAWLDAGKWFGLASNVDPNGPQVPSFTPLEFSKKRGRRVSAFTAYVKPYLAIRPNLKIVTHAVVKRIIFDDSKTQAIGVIYAVKNTENTEESIHKIYANKEVIISAGTMDSPAVLMRSGIGPEDILMNLNISPVKTLPVGYNLQDHVLVKMEFLLDRNASKEVLIAERDLTPETRKIFEETGDGPYSCFGGLSGQAFLVSTVRKSEQHPNPEWPDVQYFLMQSGEQLNFLPGQEKYEEEDYLSVYVVAYVARPKSRGRVFINPNNLEDSPLIDFNYFSDPEDHDMAILMEAVKNLVKIYEEAPSFQKMGARLSKVPLGPCRDLQFRSDEYWRCFIRHMAGSGLHAGGTCRMGSGEDDKNAVVDSKLKVIGINGLRVVDLSVMPNITNSNSQAAAYVIAEKASNMILQEYESRKDEL